MQQKELDQILSQVAHQHHISIQDVRKEIMFALEEVIDFLIHKLKES